MSDGKGEGGEETRGGRMEGGSSVSENNGGGKRGERGEGRSKGMDVGQKGKSRVRCGGDGRGGRCGAG